MRSVRLVRVALAAALALTTAVGPVDAAGATDEAVAPSARGVTVAAAERGVGVPAFSFQARPLTRAEQTRMVGVTWRRGCPVPLSSLRVVTLNHWGFDGRVRPGRLVVNAAAVPSTKAAFGALFAQRFPVRRMVPIEAYRGDDYASIEADNTSAFNCRPATGSRRWSRHAYGMAIDVNPLENPYVDGGRTSHPGSVRYLDRRRYRAGMLLAASPALRAFTRAGWSWGGSWVNPKDYQHVSR